MIVVEGPDGSGKTTLVNRLAADLDLNIGERGTTDRDLLWTVTLQDTMRAIGEAAWGREDPVIWDRLFFSDFVYAPIQDRPVAFNHAQIKHIHRALSWMQVPIIVCWPGEDVILENIMAERHQMPGVKERAQEVISGYKQIGDMIRVHQSVVYDYTKGEMEYLQLKDDLNHYLEDRSRRSL